jgi:hypothetical protein
MGELTTNQLWNTGKEDFPSQYARMIPGTSAMPRAKVLTDKSAPDAEIPRRPVSVTDEKTARSTQTRMPIQELLPHPTGDRFMVFQLVAADLLVLAAVCSLPALFNPAWGLPWASLPIFAVLVTLFGFSEGLYKNAGDPYPAGIVPILARSTLFAVGLVLSTRWDGVRPLAAFTAFTASLTGLVVWRRLKRTLSHRRRRETESRKTLIVGGGPMARSIAQALRNDPLHRANVCGFVDNDLSLSPVVLGTNRGSGLARARRVHR